MKLVNPFLLLVIALATSGLAARAAPAAEAPAREWKGRIEAIDRQHALVTVARESRDAHAVFAVTEASRIRRGDARVGFDHLVVGQGIEVRVEARPSEAAVPQATLVQILDDAALAAVLADFTPVAAADTATVVRVDAPARAFDVDGRDGPRRYRVVAGSQLDAGGEAIDLARLAPGQRVVVSALRKGSDFVATHVVVVVDPPRAEAPASQEHDARP